MTDRVYRHLEAMPLRSEKSPIIVRYIIELFTRFGLSKTAQTHQGTNFTSKYFKEKMAELGIEHITSSAYHPKS